MQGSAFQHAHPIEMAVLPFVIACLIISLLILGRWFFSRQAWAFHPGGSNGFLKDEFLRLGAIYFPFAFLMVGVRYYIYRFHPEYMQSPYFYAAFLSIIVFRRLSVFIPFVRDAGKRLDAARKAARAAKAEGAAV
jgi:hypothetical protein